MHADQPWPTSLLPEDGCSYPDIVIPRARGQSPLLALLEIGGVYGRIRFVPVNYQRRGLHLAWEGGSKPRAAARIPSRHNIGGSSSGIELNPQ
jgi:hypothetical protein